MKEKPNLGKELDKAAKQFDEFDQSVKDLTMDRMNTAPKEETEMQTKMSQNQITEELTKGHYLKPIKSIGSGQKFNEKFREQYNYMKVYVAFIAEHSELKGENIELWTRPFGGMPAEEWSVPTNKPVWGPRYLAEQIKRKFYHRLEMKETVSGDNVSGSTGFGAMYGKMAVDTTIQRLDAHPVNASRKSVFMGADGS